MAWRWIGALTVAAVVCVVSSGIAEAGILAPAPLTPLARAADVTDGAVVLARGRGGGGGFRSSFGRSSGFRAPRSRSSGFRAPRSRVVYPQGPTIFANPSIVTGMPRAASASRASTRRVVSIGRFRFSSVRESAFERTKRARAECPCGAATSVCAGERGGRFCVTQDMRRRYIR